MVPPESLEAFCLVILTVPITSFPKTMKFWAEHGIFQPIEKGHRQCQL